MTELSPTARQIACDEELCFGYRDATAAVQLANCTQSMPPPPLSSYLSLPCSPPSCCCCVPLSSCLAPLANCTQPMPPITRCTGCHCFCAHDPGKASSNFRAIWDSRELCVKHGLP